jgi:hypothetical protein
MMNLSALHCLIRDRVLRGRAPERIGHVSIRNGAHQVGSISAAERAALRAWRQRLRRSNAIADRRLPVVECFEWI